MTLISSSPFVIDFCCAYVRVCECVDVCCEWVLAKFHLAIATKIIVNVLRSITN